MSTITYVYSDGGQDGPARDFIGSNGAQYGRDTINQTTAAQLRELGVFTILEDDVPPLYIKGEPVDVLEDGVTHRTYPNAALDEEAQYNSLSSAAMFARDALLASSDWTQTVDAPLTKDNKLEWQTYRQALRDITAQASYPLTIEWPTAPSISSATDLDFASNTDVIASVRSAKTMDTLRKTIEAMEDGAQKTALLAILTILEGE